MSRQRKTAAANVATKPKPAGNTLQVPACCPKCQAIEFDAVAGGKTVKRQIHGRVHDFEYSAVTWETNRCKCGQMIAVRTYFAA